MSGQSTEDGRVGDSVSVLRYGKDTTPISERLKVRYKLSLLTFLSSHHDRTSLAMSMASFASFAVSMPALADCYHENKVRLVFSSRSRLHPETKRN